MNSGPWGPPTKPIRTLLPELPDECSESLKVPSKVLQQQAELAAAKAAQQAEERAARDAEQARIAVRRAQAMAKIQAADAKTRGHEDATIAKARAALGEAAAAAEKAMLAAAETAATSCRKNLDTERKASENQAIESVIAQVRVGDLTAVRAPEERFDDTSGGDGNAYHSAMSKMERAKAEVKGKYEAIWNEVSIHAPACPLARWVPAWAAHGPRARL